MSLDIKEAETLSEIDMGIVMVNENLTQNQELMSDIINLLTNSLSDVYVLLSSIDNKMSNIIHCINLDEDEDETHK
jgi:predicted site-specific integrase-resolvase